MSMHAYRILLPSETDDSRFNSHEKHMLTDSIQPYNNGILLHRFNCQWENIIQLLDEVEQNTVIYQWGTYQYYLPMQIIDLPGADKSRYFATTEFNNCFIKRAMF